eukprot:GDKI01010419.1.p1 GENE.GDKI01010419.1~~GDKI01010419.1.p1  ORF type:complete len:360 (-),score=67.61 GDKI01010419.1:28-1107(-)
MSKTPKNGSASPIMSGDIATRLPLYLVLISASLCVFFVALWDQPTNADASAKAGSLRGSNTEQITAESVLASNTNAHELAEQVAQLTQQVAVLTAEKSTALAESQSYGFYKVNDEEWHQRIAVLKQQRVRQEEDVRIHDQPLGYMNGRTFFQRAWEPEWSCSYEKRLGIMGDGGKWLCDPVRIPKDCLVYSFGSENKFDFEEAIYAELGCEIHTFDHTIGPNPSNKPAFVNFHPWGIDARDHNPLFTLETIIKRLGHEKRKIDIFKIDVEGYEYSTLTPLLQQKKWRKDPPIQQVLIELHVRPTSRMAQTADDTRKFFRAMADAGYVITHKEPNIEYAGGDCTEIAFLQLNIPDLPKGY